MSSSKRQLKIGYSIWPTGHHRTAWRLPEAVNTGTADPDFFAETILTAERGLFDYFFIGNSVKSDPESSRASGNEVFKIEGYTLGGYAAAITRKIGIVVTINVTYSDPYNTARAMASLDHLSRGRAGLNVVTGISGSNASGNFSRETHPDTADKYAWADEFLDVFNALVGSWEDDWLVDDRRNGVFLDPSKGHRINHTGRFFKIAGPLNVPRPPQGRIPIIHAGTSEQSFELGAKYADIRFSPYRSCEWNRAYYDNIKGRLATYGRNRDDQFILPGFTFFVGETTREAREKYRQVQNFTLNEYAPRAVSDFLGIHVGNVRDSDKVLDVIDLEKLRQDAVAARERAGGSIESQGASQAIERFTGNKLWALELALDAFGDPEAVTFRDLHNYVANFPGNQAPVVGCGKDVANWIEERFENREFDGVKVFPPYSRRPLEAFVDLVVPELQRRGIFRTEYATSTLLGHLGLGGVKRQKVAA
ncbi:NtaA/DmoA family FMN-dependent monooxygenase [Hyphomicrobium sp. 802]|uniref:NtaA/DmoA family FMN-dependent monooxygenase n=1 Tax=Hyphomicrobium sp. 802 TaxID=1112272 RepID=UPI00045E9035|nr:NtaA/DmoA family FMN-dependent monooxygenase [Hyphomicrobium sp. 802]